VNFICKNNWKILVLQSQISIKKSITVDIFDKAITKMGPLGQWASQVHGYFAFPKLVGDISNKMVFNGKERTVWSLNNYLGLANHPEVRKVDAEAAAEYGLALPMGARMMSGQTDKHEQLERELAAFVGKEAAYLLNYGYQGMVSIIDTLVDRHDVVVYDSEAHACIIDGLRMHLGKRFVYPHNDMDSLRTSLQRATKLVAETGGGILVITEGVFGMSGDLGKLDEIVAMKKDFNFRLLVDDAHGFGTMGATGAGVAEHFGVQNDVDVYFGTFAKSMASIGAFVAAPQQIITYLMYNMRSQIYAKSLPMPLVIGALKRLELVKSHPELREKLWTIANALQEGLKNNGFSIGNTQSPVTPVFLNGETIEAGNLSFDLRETYNIFCSVVVYPVVPKGVIILRLIPTAEHTLEDVEATIYAFSQVKEKLDNGVYRTGKFANVK
jgi:glycine C-acetyltransferase